ncbi:MAG TPA: SIMPL domain-containing protein [Bacteroidales bacterium]
MKSTFLCLAFLLWATLSKSQTPNCEPVKSIEVTGSAELEIEPDEIRLIIGIEEYWKEEFNKKADFKDYKTKVPINQIEDSLVKDLAGIGIKKEDIIVREVGNYWRFKGKEFLFSKQLELVLHDFKKVNEILKTINSKGIDYMRIGELKNKNITEYRKQVKIEAIKAAKEKADYLLAAIGEQLGGVISIEELDRGNNFVNPQFAISNTVMSASDNSGVDNVRKIKLRYEVKAKFGIK